MRRQAAFCLGALCFASSAFALSPLSGEVRLDPKLAGKVSKGAVLYVIARRADGGGPPVAVLRVENPKFPAAFTLNDDHQMGVSAAGSDGPLLISAKVSQAGGALTRPGDLLGKLSTPAAPGSKNIKIDLTEIAP